MQLPETLKSGEVARLFPVIAETGKEQRAASIFLSLLSAVPPFADAFLSHVGQKIGARSTVDTFTEVVFAKETDATKKDRPDGLIRVSTGKRQWSALLEVKIGKATLDRDQVERYLRLARDNDVDCLITISNEFAALPTHHPVPVQKTLIRKTGLYHVSWTSVLTEAVVMHEQATVKDVEQAFLLREFVRFFSHPSAGVTGFTSMPREWSDAIDRIQAGGKVLRGEAEAIVRAWHQESRDLALLLSRIISCRVEAKLPRAHQKDADKRLEDDVDRLCESNVLAADIVVPDAADEIQVVADLNTRSLRVSMAVDAPKDKKSTKARLNWLLRQLKGVEAEDIYVGLVWASRAATTVFPLEDLRERPELANDATSGSEVRAFEVTLTTHSARRVSGVRTFIEDLETLVPRFYEKVGQYLRSWKASPPKPKHSVTQMAENSGDGKEKPDGDGRAKPDGQGVESEKPGTVVHPPAGNDHTQLLDIPAFLSRLRH